MNPNGQPFDPNFGAPPPPGMGATSPREQLSLPSILLIIGGVLGVLNVLVSMAMQPMLERFITEFARTADPAIRDALRDSLSSMGGPLTKVLNLLSAGLYGLMTFGAWQMMNLKRYPLAFAAAIIGLLPSTCCCVTLPVSIWAIVILLKPEVKSEFK